MLVRRKEDTDPSTFDELYFSLHAMKMSFLFGCRQIIGLDGWILKTVYRGRLVVAIRRNGNENMAPIALALVPIENKESWTWFLTELLDDIGGLGDNLWIFMSEDKKIL